MPTLQGRYYYFPILHLKKLRLTAYRSKETYSGSQSWQVIGLGSENRQSDSKACTLSYTSCSEAHTSVLPDDCG